MMSVVCQVLGFILVVIGVLGTIFVCALPMWTVMAFIGSNTGTTQVIWEGLWMTCVTQITGQMRCKSYDPLLVVPLDLQAARVLLVIAIIASVVGIILGIVRSKCTNCVKETVSRDNVAIATGIIFIVAGVLVLIALCWCTITIKMGSYNSFLFDPLKRELGAAVYIGWGPSALLILGGGVLLCANCIPKYNQHQYKCPPQQYQQHNCPAGDDQEITPE